MYWKHLKRPPKGKFTKSIGLPMYSTKVNTIPLRKTGGFPSVYKPKQTLAITSHWKLNLDTDRDGVVDHLDCDPFNPCKHRIEPSKTMKKEISELPIYVKEHGKGPYHVLSKEAETQTPQARTELLSTIKHYPHLLTDIKETRKEKPDFEYVYEREKFEPGMVALKLQEDTGKFRTPYSFFDKRHQQFRQRGLQELEFDRYERRAPMAHIFEGSSEITLDDILNQVKKLDKKGKGMEAIKAARLGFNTIVAKGSSMFMLTAIRDNQPFHVSSVADISPLVRTTGKRKFSQLEPLIFVVMLMEQNLVTAYGPSVEDFYIELTPFGREVVATVEREGRWVKPSE